MVPDRQIKKDLLTIVYLLLFNYVIILRGKYLSGLAGEPISRNPLLDRSLMSRTGIDQELAERLQSVPQ